MIHLWFAGAAVALTAPCHDIAKLTDLLSRELGNSDWRSGVEVGFDGDAPWVRLRRPGQREPLERRLPPLPTCDEEATVAASVLRAWRLELEPRPLPPLALTLTKVSAPPRISWEIEGALVGGLVGSSMVPGGSLDVFLHAPESGVEFGVGLYASEARELAIGRGGARWTRSALRLELGYRLARGLWRFDLRLEALPALFYAAGEHFDHTSTDIGFDFGVGGGATVGRRLGPIELFLGVDVVDWLRQQTITAEDPAMVRAAVPSAELLLRAGVRFSARH